MPLIETSFEVPADTETVWAHLLDIEKVVPCMPGAELTETIDETHWKGKMKLKLGPVTLNFAGKVAMEERDDTAHKVVLETSAMEQRGKGAASATVTSQMEEVEGGGTRVHVAQDIKVSGQAAQFSRGMMKDVATKIVHQFADCLKAQMESEGATDAGDDTHGAGDDTHGAGDDTHGAGDDTHGAPEQEASGNDGSEATAQASDGAGSPEQAQPPPQSTPAAPSRPVPAPSAAPPAELNATRLVVAAGGRAVVRVLARVFGSMAQAFGWVAKSLERIGGA